MPSSAKYWTKLRCAKRVQKMELRISQLMFALSIWRSFCSDSPPGTPGIRAGHALSNMKVGASREFLCGTYIGQVCADRWKPCPPGSWCLNGECVCDWPLCAEGGKCKCKQNTKGTCNVLRCDFRYRGNAVECASASYNYNPFDPNWCLCKPGYCAVPLANSMHETGGQCVLDNRTSGASKDLHASLGAPLEQHASVPNLPFVPVALVSVGLSLLFLASFLTRMRSIANFGGRDPLLRSEA